MGRHSTTITSAVITPPESPSRKRKRDQSPVAEIEVDVSAPEPPSKKALRKAKKTKPTSTTTKANIGIDPGDVQSETIRNGDHADVPITSKQSDYGIWIGNLPWTATKLDLRAFFTRDTEISDDAIIRLHMPPPSKSSVAASRQNIKPQNQGFAYVDFDSKEALAEALTLSERLITGRRVLIKDAKSFEGRPTPSKGEVGSLVNSDKPPSKRIFVGNLGFDTTKEMLQDHFARCGEILNVHVATFEDSGKCKGYAWLDFEELEAAETAIRGWVYFSSRDDASDEDDEIREALVEHAKPKKNPKLRKWWVNRLGGRSLKMEFAEGKDVRYKKRFGKDGSARQREKATGSYMQSSIEPIGGISTTVAEDARGTKHGNLPSKVDARTIKPGAALATAPRLSGGIVKSEGKKTVFA